MLISRPDNPTRYVSLLIQAVKSADAIRDETNVHITRFGGVGSLCWEFECQLLAAMEGGHPSLHMKFSEFYKWMLEILFAEPADNEANSVDELFCRSADTAFGVFDASFLFIQSADRSLEKVVMKNMPNVDEVVDFE